MSVQAPGHGADPAATQLEFTGAMTDFKIMFPDMDVDVIEAVLRSNNGAVDTTIDQLLSMTADNDAGDPLSAVDSGQPPAYPNSLPSYKEAIKHDQDTVTEMLGASSLGASGGIPMHRAKNWKPPLLGKLPSDFLRLGDRHRSDHTRTGHAYTSTNHQEHGRPEQHRRYQVNQESCQQLLEDEKFAIMLQNEEFLTELRGNSEFLSTLEEEQLEPGSKVHEQPDVRRTHLSMDEALFREKLKNMGKSSRAKFAKLASKFRNGGAGKLLGHAPAPSKDNLLLNAEPLVEQRESDSDGEVEEKHSTTKGRKYQLM